MPAARIEKDDVDSFLASQGILMLADPSQPSQNVHRSLLNFLRSRNVRSLYMDLW
jgi:hypothetical protein